MIEVDMPPERHQTELVGPVGFHGEVVWGDYGVGEFKYSNTARRALLRTGQRSEEWFKATKRESQFSKWIRVFLGEEPRHDSVTILPLHESLATEQAFNYLVTWGNFGTSITLRNTFAEIQHSETQDELLGILDRIGFSRQVESFRQHVLDRQEYVGESGHPDAKLESLKAVARFLINYNPPYSDIEADLDGNVEMEWLLSSEGGKLDIDHEFWGDGSGYMAIRFVSSKAIEFAMLSGPKVEDRERLKVSGTFSHSKVNAIIEMFRDMVVLYD